ncbi:ornithine cyclodeaminase family protein [Virgibacillus oceani]|uniref:Ornithine cyclodeaminase n=1 Tax=Virgibacillus oceani TaxID=1479511 RepID=A0A917H8A3_9BACI|nr:ornithine cyclodeaminase family protein [Virgibacillus oceani]GGG70449.1 ornithine cyclodeaminase [Virgibacillus oceani]
MLFLNETAIKNAVSMKDVIDAIDEAYHVYESNHFHMPTRMQVVDKDNTLLLMPCITNNAIGTKLVTSFPNNTKHPVLHGLVILNDHENGEIRALLDGSFLTGFRTGAIGGSAVRHLAKADAAKLAIIGTGVQGLYQAIAACTERPITDIYLYNRSIDRLPAFIESLKPWLAKEIQIHSMESADTAIEYADIIITSTTSKVPVLPENPDLLKNKLIIGIGSFQPTMREFPDVLYRLVDHLFVDTNDAIIESGDIAVPIENGWITNDFIQTMSSQIISKSNITLQRDKTIVFKSTGMALFDVVVANLIYQQALRKGVGIPLN